MSILTDTARAASYGPASGRRDVLDFLVTEEQLGATAAIERASGTPSKAFVPVLRNAVTTEFHHVEALKRADDEVLVSRRPAAERRTAKRSDECSIR